MPLALCLDRPRPLRAALREVAQTGTAALELSNWRLLGEASGRELRDLRSALADHGLAVFAVHAPFGEEGNLSHLERKQRAAAVEGHERLLEVVAAVDAQVLVVHPGTAAEARHLPRMASLAAESLSALAQAAAGVGLRLGLENMLPEHPGADPADLLAIVQQVSSPWLGVCFDTGHAHVVGDVLWAFECLKAHIISFHLHDNDTTNDMHLAPGYGTIPWQALGARLSACGFCCPLSVEAPPWARSGWRQLLAETRAVLQGELLTFTPAGCEPGTERPPLHARCPTCGHLVRQDDRAWACACPPRGPR